METKPAILSAKDLFSQDNVKAKFQELLGKKAHGFITSVLQIVASNNLLAKVDPYSVYNSAAVAATLDLPLNNNLGFAYIVPYNQSYKDDKGNWQTKQVAQFQMGYKGFIQLAQRSGQFRTINAIDVRDGEIKSHDRLTGEIEFQWIENEIERLKKPVIGYVAYFKLLNGFEKMSFMTTEKLKQHGVKYSQTFKKDKGLWKDEFDVMAIKTVIKLLLSKYAPLSIDLQRAVITDQGIINDVEATDITYADNDQSLIDDVVTKEELQALVDDKMEFLTKTEFDDAKRIIENEEIDSYKKLHTLLINRNE